MIRATLLQLVAATNARFLTGEDRSDLEFHGVCTDTRAFEAGSLFVALSGPNFQADAFGAAAAEQGAAAMLLSDEATAKGIDASVPILLHEDPARALSDLAAWHRSRLSCPVLGITGSCGKTSTKNIAEELFSGSMRVVASPRSFNNQVGVPLTILLADESTELLICEIGTSGAGEIAALCRIAQPTCAIVTNVGSSHLEGLGSIEGVAAEKAELPRAVPAAGFVVVNADDRFASVMRDATSARVIDFGLNGEGSLQASDLLFHGCGTSFRVDGAEITLGLPGTHSVANLLAVLATARGLGVPLQDLLPRIAGLVGSSRRMERHDLSGLTLFDDTYNANPDSVTAAVRVLSGMHGFERRVLVLGDMLELGPRAAELHHQVGVEAARSGLGLMIVVGELARAAAAGALESGLDPERVVHLETTRAAVEAVPGLVRDGDVVLIKGSRALELERVVQQLVAERGPREVA